MYNHCAKDLYGLVNTIAAAGNCDRTERDAGLIRITLWDGRVVVSERYLGIKPPDVLGNERLIHDVSTLHTYIEELLATHRPFTTQTGVGDDALILEWKLTAEQKLGIPPTRVERIDRSAELVGAT